MADKVRFIIIAFADGGIRGVVLAVVMVDGLGGKTGLLIYDGFGGGWYSVIFLTHSIHVCNIDNNVANFDVLKQLSLTKQGRFQT